MTTIVRPVRRYRRLLLSAPAAALAVSVLAGCGGGSSATDAAPAANTASGDTGASQPSAAPSAGTGNGTRTFPGASGEIADISGKTLQVQNTSTQTAVTYTASTKITNSVTATRADLAVGNCVSVRDTATDAASTAAGTTDTPTGQLAPAAIVDPSAAVEAASVTISDAVDGACTGGFGGFGGGGFGGTRPQGSTNGQGQNRQFPGQGQSGQAQQGAANGTGNGTSNGTRPEGARGFGGGANGKVTKIDGDTITVEMTRPVAPSSAGATSTAAPTTSTRTVTLVASTTYTKTVSATASALKVGSCVTALGTADDTGAITANSIAISPAANGSCTSTGFGRFGGGNRGNGTNAAAGAAPAAGTTND